VTNVKIIRNKATGYSEGYGFAEFVDRATAERALRALNGTPMPSAHQNFRLNWATFGVGARSNDDPTRAGSNPGAVDHSIFVGDLAPEVSDFDLQETFSARYPSVRNARVVTDPSTGRSKGFGFVRFSQEDERDKALTEMNGVRCGSRAMRISQAIPRKPVPPGLREDPVEPVECATVFVGGLDASVNESNLRERFEPMGALVYVKIPPGKGCGFVQFEERRCAEAAISKLNGAAVGTSRLRLSWVRSHARGAGPAGIAGMGMGMGAVPPGMHPGMLAAAAAAANAGAYGAYGGAYHPAAGYFAHAHAAPGFHPGQWPQQTPQGVEFDQAYAAHHAAQAQQYAAAVAAAGVQQQQTQTQQPPPPFGFGHAKPQAPQTPTAANASEATRAPGASSEGDTSGDGSPVAVEFVANGRTDAGSDRRRPERAA
jgi:RNA recognition motif-containing protein